MRLTTYLPFIAALLLAAVLSVGAALLSVRVIETKSADAVNQELSQLGLDWADAGAEGLQVFLTGTAASEAERFKAITAAGHVVDAARVIDLIKVREAAIIAAPAFSIELLRNDAGVSLIGLIPAAADREATLENIRAAVEGAAVTDLLETADYPLPDGWRSAVSFGIKALGALPRSKISITPLLVSVTAVADSATQKRALEEMLNRARPRGLNIKVSISAPRPVITPFTLRFLIDEGDARFDACSADTEAARDTILSAARDAGVSRPVICTIGLGVPTPRWSEAVSAGIKALQTLGGGSITYSDADVTLIATETTAQADFDRVTGELAAALPEVFSLHSVLPEPPALEGPREAIPEFVALASPEGQIQLRGRVADQRARNATQSYARALFGSEAVYGAMRLDDALPAGWAIRVLSALEALSYLDSGSAIVQPDLVTLRGRTGDPEARAEISRLLSQKLGESENFVIEVSYEARLDPVLAEVGPTPQECVTGINAILEGSKITFAPGSSDIEGAAAETLTAIAEIVKSCEGVQMEIAGHTDSQGREEMNQQLSQGRAEAVLNALLARRVLTSGLSARGYGETNPVADNDTPEGREANRRIEFTLIAPPPSDSLIEPDTTTLESVEGAAQAAAPSEAGAAHDDSTGGGETGETADTTTGTAAPDSAEPTDADDAADHQDPADHTASEDSSQ
ncbi:OmpA family protein [Candidatus Halocynthiibacter alkanivorans]|uniref:OmpA family protein n=1 Tax=Candidatus Halocynthiibacter alkanivorans TaxID=2267619 RepID=UPI000DF4AB66|nr:OmpA family protein [Candidatus Halocynthiibacter alkanivorans]